MDKFNTAGKHISISNNGQTVTASGGSDFENAYGNIGIKSTTKNKYQWRLNIAKKEESYAMFVGIASQKYSNDNYAKIDYAYDYEGGHNGYKWHFGEHQNYGSGFKTGDTVGITVDFEKKEISFSVNDKDQGVAFTNINIGPMYYLAVSMLSTKQEIITINDFNCIGNIEEKEKESVTTIQNAKLKKENNALQQQVIDMKQQSEKQKQELTIQFNETLNNQQKQRQEIGNLQKQLKDKDNAMTVLKEEINRLKTLNNNLLDDKKEMELQINELKQENERLNRNNLDHSKWRQWDSKQVYYFIMSTVNDGSLDIYENDIKKEIFEAEYTGKDLQDIDSNDVKSMGIKKISVRKTVFRAIQNLTQKKPQMAEGIAVNAPTAFI